MSVTTKDRGIARFKRVSVRHVNATCKAVQSLFLSLLRLLDPLGCFFGGPPGRPPHGFAFLVSFLPPGRWDIHVCDRSREGDQPSQFASDEEGSWDAGLSDVKPGKPKASQDELVPYRRRSLHGFYSCLGFHPPWKGSHQPTLWLDAMPHQSRDLVSEALAGHRPRLLSCPWPGAFCRSPPTRLHVQPCPWIRSCCSSFPAESPNGCPWPN